MSVNDFSYTKIYPGKNNKIRINFHRINNDFEDITEVKDDDYLLIFTDPTTPVYIIRDNKIRYDYVGTIDECVCQICYNEYEDLFICPYCHGISCTKCCKEWNKCPICNTELLSTIIDDKKYIGLRSQILNKTIENSNYLIKLSNINIIVNFFYNNISIGRQHLRYLFKLDDAKNIMTDFYIILNEKIPIFDQDIDHLITNYDIELIHKGNVTKSRYEENPIVYCCFIKIMSEKILENRKTDLFTTNLLRISKQNYIDIIMFEYDMNELEKSLASVIINITNKFVDDNKSKHSVNNTFDKLNIYCNNILNLLNILTINIPNNCLYFISTEFLTILVQNIDKALTCINTNVEDILTSLFIYLNYNNTNLQFSELLRACRDNYPIDITRTIFDINYQEIDTKHIYFGKCNKDNCDGYTDINHKCVKCNQITCPKCNISYPESQVHTCNEEDVKNYLEICKDTVVCPWCFNRIAKLSGCNDMFCNNCHKEFNYQTGKKIHEYRHNPEAEDYKRRQGIYSNHEFDIDNETYYALYRIRFNLAKVLKASPMHVYMKPDIDLYLTLIGHIITFNNFIHNNTLEEVVLKCELNKCYVFILSDIKEFFEDLNIIYDNNNYEFKVKDNKNYENIYNFLRKFFRIFEAYSENIYEILKKLYIICIDISDKQSTRDIVYALMLQLIELLNTMYSEYIEKHVEI